MHQTEIFSNLITVKDDHEHEKMIVMLDGFLRTSKLADIGIGVANLNISASRYNKHHQTEIACVKDNVRRSYQNQYIHVHFNNQATLKALNSHPITSNITMKCQQD